MIYKYICGKESEKEQKNRKKTNSVINATMPSPPSTIKKKKKYVFYEPFECPTGVVNPKRDMRPLNEYPQHIVEDEPVEKTNLDNESKTVNEKLVAAFMKYLYELQTKKGDKITQEEIKEAKDEFLKRKAVKKRLLLK